MKPSPLPRLILTGPESTGKSTLASALADRLDALIVGEYLRDYFEAHNGVTQNDCIPIAAGQWQRELDAAQQAERLGKALICDCDIVSSLVYNRHYYKDGDPDLTKAWDAWAQSHMAELTRAPFTPRLYLLCGTDWPWVDDGQRDAPHLRQDFYAAFKTCLEAYQLPYLELQGGLEERLEQVLFYLDQINPKP